MIRARQLLTMAPGLCLGLAVAGCGQPADEGGALTDAAHSLTGSDARRVPMSTARSKTQRKALTLAAAACLLTGCPLTEDGARGDADAERADGGRVPPPDGGRVDPGASFVVPDVRPVFTDPSPSQRPAAGSVAALVGDDWRRFYEVRFKLDDGAPADGLGLPEGVVAEVGPPLRGACRDDRYFVHFPDGDWAEPPADDFGDVFRRSVDISGWWFQPPGADDHRPARDREWLRAEDEAQCHVVESIRAAAAVAYGVRADDPDFDTLADNIRVGRLCEYTSLTTPEAYAGPMVGWHLDRVGLPDAPALPALDRAVDLLLFDSGLPEGINAFGDYLEHGALGAFQSDDPAAYGPHNPHGTYMALLMRQLIGPQAHLHSWRVMDEQGRGTPHDLAYALYDALVQQDRDRPAVINLSLGWPAELATERPLYTRVIEGGIPSCGVSGRGAPVAGVESATGEAVRYMLNLARRVDEETDRAVATFAASGNRPGRDFMLDEARLAQFGTDGELDDTCLNGAGQLSQPWSMPAEWGYIPTACESSPSAVGGVSHFALTAVGVTDGLDQPGWMTKPDRDATLVAPGELVVVGAGAEAEAVDSPTHVSGSSAATAMVSAAAARVQVHRLAAGQAPLSGRAVTQHLYLTGEPMVELATGERRVARAFSSNQSDESRRLSVCRAEATLHCSAACAGCPDGEICDGALVACAAANSNSMASPLQGYGGIAIAHGGLVQACEAGCLETCLLQAERMGVDCRQPAPAAAPVWSDAGADAFASDSPAPFDGLAPMTLADPTSTIPLGYELGEDGLPLPDVYSLGELGPQPILPTCPDCMARLFKPGDDVMIGLDLLIQLNEALIAPSGEPTVAVDDMIAQVLLPSGKMNYVPLDPPAFGLWQVGEKYLATDLAAGPYDGESLKGSKVVLYTKMTILKGKHAGQTYFDESILYLEVDAGP